MKPIVFSYSGCGTCRKALAWLAAKGIKPDVRAIRETPPRGEDLQAALDQGLPLKALFNTSGGDYKELGLKDRLASMTIAEAVALLESRGNLVKRPFVLAKGKVLVGFKEDQWAEVFP